MKEYFCVFAFLRLRSLISNSISLNDTGSDLKLFPFVILFLIREILGWDSNFTIAHWTGSEIFLYSSFVAKEFSVIPKVETAFLKN